MKVWLSKNAGYHQLLKIAEVFDDESPIGQCIEHFRLTDIFKMKCGCIGPYHVELKMYLQNILTDGRQIFFLT